MIRNVKELWRFRALVWALVCRHLSTRYRGSALGFLWSFLNPLCLIGVYSLVFQYYIRFQSVENYTLFLIAGLLPWIWFSSGLLEATGSISGGGHLVTKAMFPPQILPIVSVITNLINFLLAVPLVLIFMFIAGVSPGLSILILPLVVMIELIFLAGLSLAFAALNVHYRDIQHVLGNVLMLWFFLCPILYPVSSVPEKLQFTLLLNPVALMTEMYQHIFHSPALVSGSTLIFTLLIACATFFVGNLIFNRYREEFAELI